MNNKIQKIFENYLLKNKKLIKEEIDVSDIENNPSEVGQMVADAVNEKLNSLSDEDPSKNRETGVAMMARIKQELQNPDKIAEIIQDVMAEMEAELS
tara:strand:+ start:62 stop:352 length:291 start_codon:yes stop_codon:yes gene_type:complete